MRKSVKLSPRERQIVHLLVQGQSPKEIAQNLEIAVGTVHTRLIGIGHKVAVAGRHAIVLWAIQHPECVHRDVVCEPGFHPPGCLCVAPYCQALRIIAA